MFNALECITYEPGTLTASMLLGSFIQHGICIWLIASLLARELLRSIYYHFDCTDSPTLQHQILDFCFRPLGLSRSERAATCGALTSYFLQIAGRYYFAKSAGRCTTVLDDSERYGQSMILLGLMGLGILSLLQVLAQCLLQRPKMPVMRVDQAEPLAKIAADQHRRTSHGEVAIGRLPALYQVEGAEAGASERNTYHSSDHPKRLANLERAIADFDDISQEQAASSERSWNSIFRRWDPLRPVKNNIFHPRLYLKEVDSITEPTASMKLYAAHIIEKQRQAATEAEMKVALGVMKGKRS